MRPRDRDDPVQLGWRLRRGRHGKRRRGLARLANERLEPARREEELFAIYERAAPAMENVCRERFDADLPMLQAAHTQIEAALDRLVAEALHPLDGTKAERDTVRAFTDLGVWRSLGEHGITGEAAVDTLATMLASWLERVARERPDGSDQRRARGEVGRRELLDALQHLGRQADVD